MKCKVLYETWQMQCCGVSFYVGDNVEWLVERVTDEVRKPKAIPVIDYYYDAHNNEWGKLYVLTGKVTDIILDLLNL